MLKEWLVCHNLDKAIPEAKRIVRKQQKRDNIVYTIGFKMNNGSIAFSRVLFTNDRFDLNELMSIYNRLKIKYSIEKIIKQPVIVKLKYNY